MTEIITRGQWGARYGRGFGERAVGNLETILHHSVTTQLKVGATFAEDAQQIRNIEAIGQQRFGGGISYTFLIPPSGRIFEGHGITRIGAHTTGHNTKGAAICLVGDYSSRKPSAKQIAAVQWLLAYGVAKGWWKSKKLTYYHGQLYATACPGKGAVSVIPEINGGTVKVSVPTSSLLRYGSEGSQVKEAQKRLNVHGAKLDVDGDFGPKTLAAVKSFQKAKKLDVDGIIGDKTWAALKKEPAAAAKPKDAAPLPGGKSVINKILLKEGSTGDKVKKLQALMSKKYPSYAKLDVDGIYGPKTKAAVKEFQRRVGYSATGNVDTNTAKRMGLTI